MTQRHLLTDICTAQHIALDLHFMELNRWNQVFFSFSLTLTARMSRLNSQPDERVKNDISDYQGLPTAKLALLSFFLNRVC